LPNGAPRGWFFQRSRAPILTADRRSAIPLFGSTEGPPNPALKLERAIERRDLIVIDELGYVPLGQNGAENLFGFFSKCYDDGANQKGSTCANEKGATEYANQVRGLFLFQVACGCMLF
jgi:hypothetical protein